MGMELVVGMTRPRLAVCTVKYMCLYSASLSPCYSQHPVFDYLQYWTGMPDHKHKVKLCGQTIHSLVFEYCIDNRLIIIIHCMM